MLQQAQVSNPKDYSVVSFRNSTEFGFTPEMGCMYNGRPINGASGSGINAGESITLPYHVGNQLAINLAKRVLNTSPAATIDPAGIPTGVPIWSADKLEEMKLSFLTELYTEAKPVAQSETDRLMAKVEEYKAMVEKLIPNTEAPKVEEVAEKVAPQSDVKVYMDKAEVIAELTKRGIKFDARQNKANLEKLLA